MERLARAAGVHAAPTVEAEQRCVGFGRALDRSRSTCRASSCADARSVRDKAVLAELAAPHDEQLPVGVDVAEAQPARLSGAQPKAVAESEDGVVGRPAADGPRVVGKRRGCLEQLTGLGGVEQERQAPRRLPSPGPAQRRGLQALLGDGPVKEAAERPRRGG